MANEVYKNDSGLVGLWLLDEASGQRNDYTANANHLTDNGTVGSSSDLPPNPTSGGTLSADFEQDTPNWLSITDAAQNGVLDVTGNLTLCCWAKAESLTAVGNSGHTTISKYSTTDNQRSYILTIRNNAGNYKLHLGISSNGTSGGTSTLISDGATLSAATWYHIAAVYNGTVVTFYLNGAQDGSTHAYSSGIFNGTADFRIGYHGSNVWPFDGLIKDAAVFNRALSAAEVASIYNFGISGFGPLVGGKLVNHSILQGRLVR